MNPSKYSCQDAPIGTLVQTCQGCDYEVIIDIYDDEIFHTIAPNGTVMQYNFDDILSIGGHLDISQELDAITSKIPRTTLQK
jgi:hypothetical protein